MDTEKTPLEELIKEYWLRVGQVYKLTAELDQASRKGNWVLLRKSHLELTWILDRMDTLAIEYETTTGKSADELLAIVENM